MARTKQTACKTDTKGRPIKAIFDEPDSTMDKPTTSQAPHKIPDQPDQPDIDPTDIQQPASQAPGDPAVKPPAAAPSEEEIVEVKQKAAGEAEGTAGPCTSQSLHKHKATDDDSDKESKAYKAFSHAAAETWRDSVIKATNEDKAKQTYNTLYEMLYQQVLPI